MLQQDTRYRARGPAHSKQVSAAHITAAAFGIGAGLAWAAGSWIVAAVSDTVMLRLTPAVTAATPFVLTLILLSALAHDSQPSQTAQQPEGPPPNGRGEHMEVRHGQD